MPQVTVKPVQIVKIKPQHPNPLIAPEIELKAITRDTVDKALEENPFYMGLSYQDYLANAQFEQEKLTYIKQLLKILEFYEQQSRENYEEAPPVN